MAASHCPDFDCRWQHEYGIFKFGCISPDGGPEPRSIVTYCGSQYDVLRRLTRWLHDVVFRSTTGCKGVVTRYATLDVVIGKVQCRMPLKCRFEVVTGENNVESNVDPWTW